MKRVGIQFHYNGRETMIGADMPETDEERRVGLSGKPVARPMLFEHNGEFEVTYSMEKMIEPIDVLFFDTRGFFINIEHGWVGRILAFRSRAPIGAVLEVKRGTCDGVHLAAMRMVRVYAPS